MKNLNTLQNTRFFSTGYVAAPSGKCAAIILALSFIFSAAFSQAPDISYKSPQTFKTGFAINSVSPTNTGGAVPLPSPVIVGRALSGGNIAAMAIDGSNNIYIGDNIKKTITKIPAGGGNKVIIATGVEPGYMVADAAGNVYFSNSQYPDFSIYKIAAGTSTKTLVTDYYYATGLAIDAAGNLYFSDYEHGDIREMRAGKQTSFIAASGLGFPEGIAVDAAGNLYTTGGAKSITKILAGSKLMVSIPVVNGPGAFVFNIAVDNSGNLYVASYNSTTVTEIPASGGSNIVIGSGFYNSESIAIDTKGDIFVGNASSGTQSGGGLLQEIAVGGYKISPALPAGLNFNANTGVISGTPEAAAPAANYTVTATNSSGTGSTVINLAVDLPVKPTFNYPTPQTYTVGTAIAALAPTATANSRVAAIGYGSEQTVASGFTRITGMATDAAGNLYVADFNSGNITKIPPGGTPVVYCSVEPGIKGISFDASGNMYVADSTAMAIKKISAGGGTPVVVYNAFHAPISAVMDASGNLFVSETYDALVTEVPAGGGPTFALGGDSLAQPGPLALDGQGNLLVADYMKHSIYEVQLLTGGGSLPVLVNSQFISPVFMTIDAGGNLFVGDNGVHKVCLISAGSTNTAAVPVYLGSGGIGVAVDGAGNLYTGTKTAAVALKPLGGYYISPFLPVGLNFNPVTGVISGTPAVVVPATNYTVTAANAGGNGSATIKITAHLPAKPQISYSGAQAYATGAAITPLIPTSTGVAAVAYTNLGAFKSGLNGPSGVCVDAAGNVYVTNTGNHTVLEFPAGGGARFDIGTGFNYPNGIAVDAAGNVYVSDSGANTISKIPAGGGAPVVIGTGFNDPTGVAVDAAGNVYVADWGNDAIKKIPAGGGATITLGNGFTDPSGVALDAAGNVYVADYGDGTVKKIPADGSKRVVVTSGYSNLGAVAVDAAGDVFTGGFYDGLLEIRWAGGAPVSLAPAYPYQGVSGIAVDAAGNIYVAEQRANLVYKVKPLGGYYIGPFLPAGLNFNETTGAISGTPTAISPATNYTVTAYNTGGGSTATVRIKIYSKADLDSLQPGAGQLSPVFTPGTTSYTDNVTYANASISITAVASDSLATITVNGIAVASGSPSQAIPLTPGSNTITIVVTARDGSITKTYTLNVVRGPSSNANLSQLHPNAGYMTQYFTPAISSFTDSVTYRNTSVRFTPIAQDTLATIKINGVAIASGALSQVIPLNEGSNTVTTVVTAPDGVTAKTYTVTVIRAFSSDANLSFMHPTAGMMSPIFTPAITSYTDTVNYTNLAMEITPIAHDSLATVTVNGLAVVSGSLSQAISLNEGLNTITTVVTAPDGVTTKTFTITVFRAFSTDAYLTQIQPSAGMMSPVFNPMITSYTDEVNNSNAAITLTPAVRDPLATITVNGAALASGATSPAIPLAVGSNTVTTIVTAPDGVTTKTYTLSVTRDAFPLAALNAAYQPIGVAKVPDGPQLADDGILVHQGISPNGDGINDFLVIENISQYPDNKLSIMNRDGQLIFEAKGYDNSSKVFDGHSNKNGQMQLPGTYFYQLDYTVKGILKHKTGFVMLKY